MWAEISEIVDIISKKYPNVYFNILKNFSNYVSILVNEKEYRVPIKLGAESLSFVYDDDYSLHLKGFKITILNYKATEKEILFKFKTLLGYIKKLDFFISNKNEIEKKIKPIIISYIKKEYNVDIDFLNDEQLQSRSFLKVSFPVITKYVRNKGSKTIFFDFKKQKIKDKNIAYQIYVRFYIINSKLSEVTFTMEYKDEKITLIGKDEYYNELEDITKIIRSEKLQSLFK